MGPKISTSLLCLNKKLITIVKKMVHNFNPITPMTLLRRVMRRGSRKRVANRGHISQKRRGTTNSKCKVQSELLRCTSEKDHLTHKETENQGK